MPRHPDMTRKHELSQGWLYTGQHLQLVLMTLQPGEEIGAKSMTDRDQFFRFEEGEGDVDDRRQCRTRSRTESA